MINPTAYATLFLFVLMLYYLIEHNTKILGRVLRLLNRNSNVNNSFKLHLLPDLINLYSLKIEISEKISCNFFWISSCNLEPSTNCVFTMSGSSCKSTNTTYFRNHSSPYNFLSGLLSKNIVSFVSQKQCLQFLNFKKCLVIFIDISLKTIFP